MYIVVISINLLIQLFHIHLKDPKPELISSQIKTLGSNNKIIPITTLCFPPLNSKGYFPKYSSFKFNFLKMSFAFLKHHFI